MTNQVRGVAGLRDQAAGRVQAKLEKAYKISRLSNCVFRAKAAFLRSRSLKAEQEVAHRLEICQKFGTTIFLDNNFTHKRRIHLNYLHSQ